MGSKMRFTTAGRRTIYHFGESLPLWMVYLERSTWSTWNGLHEMVYMERSTWNMEMSITCRTNNGAKFAVQSSRKFLPGEQAKKSPKKVLERTKRAKYPQWVSAAEFGQHHQQVPPLLLRQRAEAMKTSTLRRLHFAKVRTSSRVSGSQWRSLWVPVWVTIAMTMI